jgi:hypothetical protein
MLRIETKGIALMFSGIWTMLPLVVDAKLWNESALLAKRFPKKKF